MSGIFIRKKNEWSSNTLGAATNSVHSGYNADNWTYKPIVLPIVSSSIYKYDKLDPKDGYYYSRCGNPTRTSLEETLANLENAKYGLCFPSGMAAIVAMVHLLKAGDHIICSNIVYGGATYYFEKYCSRWSIDVTFVDLVKDLSNLKTAVTDKTKLIWIEPLMNPTLNLIDLSIISDIISSINRPDIILGVDNTFLTSFNLKPLDYGADVVMYSASKYLNGHSDVIMGVLVTRREDLYVELLDIQKSSGMTSSPNDCYMVSRSLKTLKVRMQEHARNAMETANFLETHPMVEKVIYPGLKSHPQHDLAKRQLLTFGGMVSFYLALNGFSSQKDQVETFLKSVKVITYSASLGGAESILAYPWTTSHATLSPDTKISLGIKENLVRISVGLENSEDIIGDLDQALNKMMTEGNNN